MKIRLRILGAEQIQSMNCVVLSRLGDVYACIGNIVHPLSESSLNSDYSRLSSAVDWMLDNRVNSGCRSVNRWIACQLKYCYNRNLDFESSIDALFVGIEPSDRTIELCKRLWEQIDTFNYSDEDCLKFASDINSYFNQNFLRVKGGGNFSSRSATICFSISSKDYDWRPVIEDFLWDIFKSIDNMPSLICIEHDEEIDPPGTILFEGSPEELFDGSNLTFFN